MTKKTENASESGMKPELVTRYRVTGKDGKGIILEYIGGQLESISNIHGAISLWDILYFNFPSDFISKEENILKINNSKFKIQKVPVPSAYQKIKMFCEAFEIYFGISYKTAPGDGKKLEPFDINPELLKTYFDVKKDQTNWWAGEKSIRNFTGNYNSICLIARNAAAGHGGANSQTTGNKPADLADMAASIIKKRHGKSE